VAIEHPESSVPAGRVKAGVPLARTSAKHAWAVVEVLPFVHDEGVRPPFRCPHKTHYGRVPDTERACPSDLAAPTGHLMRV
jgi:hypothetical protein